jgi:hypothetical protein
MAASFIDESTSNHAAGFGLLRSGWIWPLSAATWKGWIETGLLTIGVKAIFFINTTRTHSMPTAAKTNWIRLSGPTNTFTFHFASRDWKVLSDLDDEAAYDWLDAFGFVGHGPEFSVARGLQIGCEVSGRRSAMLHSTELLLPRLTKEAELLIYDYSVTMSPGLMGEDQRTMRGGSVSGLRHRSAPSGDACTSVGSGRKQTTVKKHRSQFRPRWPANFEQGEAKRGGKRNGTGSIFTGQVKSIAVLRHAKNSARRTGRDGVPCSQSRRWCGSRKVHPAWIGEQMSSGLGWGMVGHCKGGRNEFMDGGRLD